MKITKAEIVVLSNYKSEHPTVEQTFFPINQLSKHDKAVKSTPEDRGRAQTARKMAKTKTACDNLAQATMKINSW